MALDRAFSRLGPSQFRDHMFEPSFAESSLGPPHVQLHRHWLKPAGEFGVVSVAWKDAVQAQLDYVQQRGVTPGKSAIPFPQGLPDQ